MVLDTAYWAPHKTDLQIVAVAATDHEYITHASAGCSTVIEESTHISATSCATSPKAITPSVASYLLLTQAEQRDKYMRSNAESVIRRVNQWIQFHQRIPLKAADSL